MPAYDFRCTECGTIFEVHRSMGTTGDESCPTCNAVATKVFTPVGVAFKGSGFHNTDYRPRPKEESGSCAGSVDGAACSSCPAAAAE